MKTLYLEDDAGWADLHKLALAKQQVARLELIAADNAVLAIEEELARWAMVRKGIAPRVGTRLLMDYQDAPNTLCEFAGFRDGKITVYNIGAKGQLLKTLQHLPYTATANMRKVADK